MALSSATPSFAWAKTWGGTGNEIAHNVAVDRWGNLYVIGEFVGTVDFDPDPAKTAYHSSYNGTIDAFLGKFDSNGTFQWAKTWGGSGDDAAGGLAADRANNVYATGMFSDTVNFDPDGTANVTSNGSQDVFFNQFASNGSFQWVKTWGGSANDWGYHLALDGTGNLYAVGSFQGTVDLDPGRGVGNHTSNGGSDAFLSKFLPIWTKPIYLPLVVR